MVCYGNLSLNKKDKLTLKIAITHRFFLILNKADLIEHGQFRERPLIYQLRYENFQVLF